jgi:hypothetical protein
MRRRYSRSALVLVAAASLAASATVLAQQEEATQLPPGQFPAVLKSREVSFIYRSSTTPLSCDLLRNRVAAILRAVGARDDVQVSARECDAYIPQDPRSRPSSSGPSVTGGFEPGTGGPLTNPYNDRMNERMRAARGGSSSFDQYDRYRSQTTPVHITVMMPVVVTPEIVAEVERDKSRRELISRVRGNPAAAMDDPIFFPAERREITLSHDTIELDVMDCELVEQMTRTVFRSLDLQVTGQAVSCDPRSHLRPNLKVEALVPVGLLMPGEQKLKERADKEAQKKAREAPPQPEAAPQPETSAQAETPSQ